ncbi:MAG: hypothetical protein ACREP7_14120 [Lysobacter sp.]
MTTATQSLTADDVGRRVLKLIDSIQGAKDIAPAHIEQTTGIKVDIWSEDQSKYGFNGKLSDVWYYGLRSMPADKPGDKPSSLLFSFSDNDDDKSDPSAVCLKFKDYSQALTAAGFAGKPVQGYRGVDSWYFTRGNVAVTAYVFGKGDPDAPGACLSQLIISAQA